LLIALKTRRRKQRRKRKQRGSKSIFKAMNNAKRNEELEKAKQVILHLPVLEEVGNGFGRCLTEGG